MDAIQWMRRGEALGAGELVVNSIDTDGVKQGFDLALLRLVTEAVNIPVIASGGAGSAQDFVDLFRQIPGVDAGLAASVFHYGELSIPGLKRTLADAGINVRMAYESGQPEV
jgi:cyclase